MRRALLTPVLILPCGGCGRPGPHVRRLVYARGISSLCDACAVEQGGQHLPDDLSDRNQHRTSLAAGAS